MKRLFGALHKEERALSRAAWAHVGALAVFLLAAPWDSRLVTGVNPWIKPMKFAASIAIFIWSVAWLLRYLPSARGFQRFVRVAVPAVMGTEMALIAVQSARGRASHFNTNTPEDELIFTALAALIFANTLLMAGMLFHFMERKVKLEAAYLTGIRLGLAIFLLGSLQGMAMVLNMGHTVGLADGGAGLPLVHWSTQSGDLRVAHAVGLHALQILPLAGFAVDTAFGEWPRIARVGTMMAVGLGYLSGFGWLFRQAVAGRALVAL